MNKVRIIVQDYNMISPGETVLVAVSGGADSMCLLHLLWHMGEKSCFRVEAATFDHQIRAQGAEDAAFVAHWCEGHGIPCHKGCANVPEQARRQKAGLEETARALRYAFLQETAKNIGASKIATAHNANDNAETMLLHLVRGTGLKGLGGIPPVRDNLIRPLLTAERSEIEEYLTMFGIPHVEDATNGDIQYDRNYIRHQVLPLLRAKNPGLLAGLGRSARSLRADSLYLEAKASEITDQAVREGTSLSLPAELLLALPEALSSRVIQQLAERLQPETVLSDACRRSVLGLCRSQRPSAECLLTGNLKARREYDRLVLAMEPETAGFLPVTLAPGEQTIICGRVISCERAVCPDGKFNQPQEFYLKPCGTLLLRPRKTGDTITLPARNRKSVKKLLSDSKVPRHCREQIAVFEANGSVAALDGFGADVRFLPKPGDTCWKITSSPFNPSKFAETKA